MAEWGSEPAQPTLSRRKEEKEPIWCIRDVPAICTSFLPHSADEEAEVQYHRGEAENLPNRQTLLQNPRSAPKLTPPHGMDGTLLSLLLSFSGVMTRGLRPKPALLRGMYEQPWKNAGSPSTPKTSREAPVTGHTLSLEA